MDTLSSRERVAIALSHQEPDRVPLDIGEGRQTSIYLKTYLEASKILGLNGLDIVTSRRGTIDRFDERFLGSLGIDFRRVSLRNIPRVQTLGCNGLTRDEWGIGWKQEGPFSFPLDPPLKNATIDDLHRYNWPDPNDERFFRGLREKAEFMWTNTKYSLVANQPNHAYGVLTTSWFLRGMENFFVDLIVNKEFASELMGKVLQYHLKIYEKYLEEVGEFIDIVQTGDDLGMQTGPLFSLSTYREMIKAKEKKLFDLIKTKTEARIFYHCDGAISEFIDDLIEIGVDILNPIQPLASGMNPLKLKSSFGDRLSFHGGIDQQQVLTRGTVDEVREEVKRRLKQLAPGGGYILAAAHNILPEVPGENVVEIFRAAKQHGEYPIKNL